MADRPDVRTDLDRRPSDGWTSQTETAGVSGTSADLSVEQILAWADAHHAAHGVWPAVGPGAVSGVIAGAPGESWKAINHALALGLRGLPGDSSLAELLAEHRGAPLLDMGPKALAEKIWAWEQEHFPVMGPTKRRCSEQVCPRLTVGEILSWAEVLEAATGEWPKARSGPVRGAPFDVNWRMINEALSKGLRGLPGGSSLARLRTQFRDFRPPLTVERILSWADAHHAAVGIWPNYLSGEVLGAPGETWVTLDVKLRVGGRGLPGGSSLARLLVEHRGIRNGDKIARLTVEQILDWADNYHAVHGRWPDYHCGQVDPARSETWCAINSALVIGRHGLPGGSTLARLLIEHRGPDASHRPKRMNVEQVLAWADAYRAANGRWPRTDSGVVAEAPDITWSQINGVLAYGGRGLPVAGSLCELLVEHRGHVNCRWKPTLTIEQILAWADAYHAIHHRWPRRDSGLIPGTGGESWARLDRALHRGRRGLPRSIGLSHFLEKHRGARRSSPRAL